VQPGDWIDKRRLQLYASGSVPTESTAIEFDLVFTVEFAREGEGSIKKVSNRPIE